MWQVSCEAYRAVVRGDPRFVDYFGAATPVSELGRMNIGSRPAKRKAAPTIDTLRAIPWIFARTQTRFNLPVWLGMGAAFKVGLVLSESVVEGDCFAFTKLCHQKICVKVQRMVHRTACYARTPKMAAESR